MKSFDYVLVKNSYFYTEPIDSRKSLEGPTDAFKKFSTLYLLSYDKIQPANLICISLDVLTWQLITSV